MSVESFFKFARDRHDIYLKRKAGQSRPWTEDPILHQYRFTNVFRELDATTVWFKNNVREPMRAKPEVLLATVLFRWFNRVTTGEAIFKQKCFGMDNQTPWEMLITRGVEGGALVDMAHAIRAYSGTGPCVTGAYIIKTPDGYDKLRGVLQCVEWFMTRALPWPGIGAVRTGYDAVHRHIALGNLEFTWQWLRQFPYMGDFMAYEVVTDLAHTDLLCNAPDIMTWANPGPGAARGAGRVFHGDKDKYDQKRDKQVLIERMRELLRLAPDFGWDGQYSSPRWTMREVEHTLCEFDKYERARTGEGRPRGTYR